MRRAGAAGDDDEMLRRAQAAARDQDPLIFPVCLLAKRQEKSANRKNPALNRKKTAHVRRSAICTGGLDLRDPLLRSEKKQDFPADPFHGT